MNLTDAQLNVTVCEWMGWYSYLDADCKTRWHNRITGEDADEQPDYTSDDSPRRLLNEAEARLSIDQKFSFIRNLCRLLGVSSADFAFINATARQRTIAILKTVKPEMFQQ